MIRLQSVKVEDFRIYLSVGSIAMLGWILLPLFVGVFSADTVAGLNVTFRILGQVLLIGLVLPLLPVSLRFIAILVFFTWLTPVANEIFSARCDLVMARFSFSLGEYPSCVYRSSI